MTQIADKAEQYDPWTAWRLMRDSTLDFWSKTISNMVNTEAAARMTGLWLDAYLNVTNPVQRLTQTAATQMLEQLNMPTRDDVTRVAERLTKLEMRLDDLDAAIDSLESQTRGEH